MEIVITKLCHVLQTSWWRSAIVITYCTVNKLPVNLISMHSTGLAQATYSIMYTTIIILFEMNVIQGQVNMFSNSIINNNMLMDLQLVKCTFTRLLCCMQIWRKWLSSHVHWCLQVTNCQSTSSSFLQKDISPKHCHLDITVTTVLEISSYGAIYIWMYL